MATTSGNLTVGKARSGQGGDGDGRFTLKAKLALGVALLGCAGALAFGGLRAAGDTPGQAATGSAAARGAHVIWTGTCRAGSSDCLPGDDDVAPGVARTMPQAWTGTCRAGSSDCLPDEDLILGVAPAAPTGDTAMSDRVGPREFLENEGPIAPVVASTSQVGCVYTDVSGVPGEGCGAVHAANASAASVTGGSAGPREFLESEATTAATAHLLPALWNVSI